MQVNKQFLYRICPDTGSTAGRRTKLILFPQITPNRGRKPSFAHESSLFVAVFAIQPNAVFPGRIYCRSVVPLGLLASTSSRSEKWSAPSRQSGNDTAHIPLRLPSLLPVLPRILLQARLFFPPGSSPGAPRRFPAAAIYQRFRVSVCAPASAADFVDRTESQTRHSIPAVFSVPCGVELTVFPARRRFVERPQNRLSGETVKAVVLGSPHFERHHPSSQAHSTPSRTRDYGVVMMLPPRAWNTAPSVAPHRTRSDCRH